MLGFFCVPLFQVGLKVRSKLLLQISQNYLSELTRKNYNETFFSFITSLQNKTKQTGKKNPVALF